MNELVISMKYIYIYIYFVVIKVLDLITSNFGGSCRCTTLKSCITTPQETYHTILANIRIYKKEALFIDCYHRALVAANRSHAVLFDMQIISELYFVHK